MHPGRNKYPRHLRKLLDNKKRIWRSMKKSSSNQLKLKYKECIHVIKREKHLNNLAYESKIIESKNIGAIYKHINSRMTHKTGIAPLSNEQGVLIFDDCTKAELLNNHFVKAGTWDNGVLPPLCELVGKLDSVYFDRLEIAKVIEKLKTNSSPGPDGIPPIVLKSVKHAIVGPLALLFSLIFQFGSLPNIWKMAIVKPIFKKGNASDPNNYRPISLTCVICKVFESIIKTNCFIS